MLHCKAVCVRMGQVLSIIDLVDPSRAIVRPGVSFVKVQKERKKGMSSTAGEDLWRH